MSPNDVWISTSAPRTGWGLLNVTPREAICSYKGKDVSQRWREYDDNKTISGSDLISLQRLGVWRDIGTTSAIGHPAMAQTASVRAGQRDRQPQVQLVLRADPPIADILCQITNQKPAKAAFGHLVHLSGEWP